MSVYYLTVEDISKINAFQITNYSPKEQMGVKDLNALEMTVNQPSQNIFNQELYPSMEEKAAVLMINIVKRHPFFNANKRTAMMAVDSFLQFNGYEIQFELDEGIQLVIDIATYEKDDFENLKAYVSKVIKSKIKR
ncbi:type II toxin-antitoxin system death-on-curing family toxin [Tetragenococcus koreensis]|uniref:type II toxin-antitoxin system death-on-curing family toxin n=1 Tax=Tetragenococcus koreensis TaxID=290335 RepID=UPI001F01BE15|nr:type II toxin-antitoxin system death-on-curing family toxin [Tetragenococcus koreensis]MDN6840200.1 type II toxin-antitoxin system death-on-curing family toxin [Tetragenococcus halophilus]MCF1586334.1 type II toxin-antitoxin system death-on-curing family toxin [Tetragenococcus koreensis]MCF1614262.1 type II toxin-antitoxin system death-on-curing family toxin [Tetragenococcus koreensis]MCF1623985.1 type II toxin-antitoxin system death-on-curing family toxin [Tetragenococcus koreensis]MCF1630